MAGSNGNGADEAFFAIDPDEESALVETGRDPEIAAMFDQETGELQEGIDLSPDSGMRGFALDKDGIKRRIHDRVLAQLFSRGGEDN